MKIITFIACLSLLSISVLTIQPSQEAFAESPTEIKKKDNTIEKSFVEIDYNRGSGDIRVWWEFPNPTTCHLKTQMAFTYTLNNGTTTNQTIHFVGSHSSDIVGGGNGNHNAIVADSSSLMSCKGEITFNRDQFGIQSDITFTMFASLFDETGHGIGEASISHFLKSNGWGLLNCGALGEFDIGTEIYISPHLNKKIYVIKNPCLIQLIQLPSISNGGGCADCVKPTLGLDPNFNRVVDYGFSYNENKVQVDEWYTEFPLIEVNVGEENLLEVKVYENNGINNMKWIQVCFGASEKGISLEECEALVTVHLETNGTTDWIGIEKIVLIDKDNLLDNLVADVYVTDCEDNPSSQNPRQCVKLDLYHTFREAPLNNMVIINVADKSSRNSQNFHFNHGIEVHGISLNGEPTITLFEKHTSQDNENNWNTYTRDSKVNDTWTDENKIQYQRINDNSFVRLTPLPDSTCKDKPLDQINVPTRINCNYTPYKEQQALDTLEIMTELCPSCLLPSFYEMKESFAYEFPPKIDKSNDSEMIKLLEIEAQKALEYLQSHRQ